MPEEFFLQFAGLNLKMLIDFDTSCSNDHKRPPELNSVMTPRLERTTVQSGTESAEEFSVKCERSWIDHLLIRVCVCERVRGQSSQVKGQGASLSTDEISRIMDMPGLVALALPIRFQRQRELRLEKESESGGGGSP